MQNNPLLGFADEPRWVNWRRETDEDGKPTKILYHPNGYRASTTNPATWSPLAGLARQGFDGPGIVFTPDKRLLGTDGDHLFNGKDITDKRFAEFVKAVHSYTEISPSGDGLHPYLKTTEALELVAHTHVPYPGVKYEVYNAGRYFTVTFKPFVDLPIRTVTPAEAIDLLAILGYPWSKARTEPTQRGGAGTPDDERLLQVIWNARNGAKVRALYEGDTAGYNDDDSAADMALCCHLAFYTKDPAQIERLWLQSPLGQRDKTQQREDYRDRTIQAALSTTTSSYSPNGRVDPGAHVDMSRAPEDDKAPVTNTLPDVRANSRELRDVSQDAMEAAAVAGGVYVRGGELARVRVDDTAHASIETMSESALRGKLARAANFYRAHLDKNGEIIRTPIAPPLDVVRDILSLGAWDFPPIEGVIESPTMRPDGTILCTPGYDPATKLFYQPARGFVLPPIPEHPSQDEVMAARERIYDVFCDFPCVNDASRDNTVATIFTMVTRPMIDGPVPIPIFDAPQQGTGKTLAGSLAAQIATGSAPSIGTAPTDPEEWRKRITSELSTGKPAIIFDNVTGVIDDPSLAAASTSRVWTDRGLGTNKMIVLPQRAMFMVAGNNVKVGGDLVRRCYSIRLDAEVSRPWERAGFKHDAIERWVSETRAPLVAAVLTLARSWVNAGRPEPTGLRMGSYESWIAVVGGIMQHIGASNFLGNLNEFYESADDDTPAWEAFIVKLHELFGDAETTCTQVFTRMCPDPEAASTEDLTQYVPQDVAGLLDIKSKAKFVQRLGYEFKARQGKRHGTSMARIKKGRAGRASTWCFYVGEKKAGER